MQDRQQCPLCLKTGLVNYLQSYQINLEEAVVLCENKLCPYPLANSATVATTFSRTFEEISLVNENAKASKIPDAQVALQTKVAHHMRKFGHRLQKDAIGIQTGSPQLKKKLNSFSSKSRKSNKREITSALPSQTGSNNLPQVHLPQTCSQSFQNFQSFSQNCQMVGATNGTAWSNCNGSEGSSDKDSLLNSSLDSLDSNSSSSSSSSTGGLVNIAKAAKYSAFQFEQCNTRSSNKSMPNLQKPFRDALQLNGHSCKDVQPVSDNVPKVAGNIEQILPTQPVIGTLIQPLKPDVTYQCVNFTQMKSKTNVHEPQDLQNGTDWQEHTVEMKTCSFKGDNLLRYPSVFPQWRNKDALCWLDVILCLAVHNETLKTLVFKDDFDKNNLIYKLLKAHNQACQLLQRSQRVSSAQSSCPNTESSSSLKRTEKDINQTQQNGADGENIVPTDGSYSDEKVQDLLDDIREEIWGKLKQRLKCEKGENESPVFALPLLLKEEKAVEDLFRMNYWFEYMCSSCGKHERTEHSNTLPTFPAVVEDFRLCDPQHNKTCPKCGNSKDGRTMVYRKLPECLLMHFTDGLPDISLEELQFGFHGDLYTVTGVVQYINQPDHFIAWLRNPDSNKWLKCDDLRPMVCRYRSSGPKFPSSQIHIVMWERLQTKPRICRQVAIETDRNQSPGKEQLLNAVSATSDTGKTKVTLKKDGNVPSVGNTKKVITSVKYSHLNSVRPAESSCSTLSTDSSDSILLPNFISSTPASESVLRPVPKPVFSVPNLEINPEFHSGYGIQMHQEVDETGSFEDSEMKGLIKDQKDENSSLLQILKDNTDSSSIEPIEKISLTSLPVQICGPKSLIKPSTVFCVPKKSSEQLDMAVSCEDKLDASDNQSVKMETNDTGDGVSHFPLELKDLKSEPSIEQKLDSNSTNVTERNMKTCEEKEQSVNKSEKECEKEIKELADVKTENTETEMTKRKSNSSKLSSRFKVPRLSVKRPSISRDAFFTLEPSNGSVDSSACDTPVSVSAASSPGLTGNLNFLNSVKQYLISRTTGRTEQKFKFEGLNLKSASNRRSFAGLSEFVLPNARRNVSSTGSNLPVMSSSACDSLETRSLDSSSSETSLSATSALVTELIERLDQNPARGSKNPMTLKRKLDSTLGRSPKKIFKDTINEFDKLSSGNTSLKENTNVYHRKKIPSGKKMKLIRNLVKNSDKATNEQEGNKLIYNNGNEPNGSETKCDTESVLQDLYEALNIPFSSVNATMSDIMSDVDELLDFVSEVDMPGQDLDDRPASSVGGSLLGNQKHSNCWLRIPGRNSA